MRLQNEIKATVRRKKKKKKKQKGLRTASWTPAGISSLLALRVVSLSKVIGTSVNNQCTLVQHHC